MTTTKKEITEPIHSTPNDSNTYHFLDEKVTILVSGEDTDGKYAILNSVKPAKQGPPLHRHEIEEETFIVKRGQMTFYVDDKVIEAKEGDVVVAPRGSKHTFITGPEGAEFNIIARPAGFDGFVKALGTLVPANAPLPQVGPPTEEQIIGLVNASKPFGITYPEIEKAMPEKQ